MKIKNTAAIVITIWLTIITSCFIAIAAIDAPHNESNNISCGSCHGINSPFWGGTISYDQLCLSCHNNSLGGPYTPITAPAAITHSAENTDSEYWGGDWAMECRDCHDPHYQKQKSFKFTDASNLYLATGTITSSVYNPPVPPAVVGTSTLTYSTNPQTPFTYKSGWDAAKLTQKTLSYRRTILFPDASSLSYNYPIISIDSDAKTITVSGNVTIASPTTFAAIYGQYIKNYINVSGLNKQVKFFDQTGTKSFADGDTTYNGVCEVCHTQTTYHRNNTSGDHTHYVATNCVSCHPHKNGFAHGGGTGTGCEDCHGHDNGWGGGTYSGTTISHSTHTENDTDDFRGPLPSADTCTDCHDTNNYPKFSDGNYLSGTNICDTCHSPGGGFNGVVSTGVSIGAKDNWETGVYQVDGTLTPGKVKWCAGCHDNAPSEVDGKTAPDIAGDNTTYGYYQGALGAHGNGTYGVKRQGVSYAQGECLHCHDVSVAKILPTRIINESFEKNPGYDESGWTEPAGNPDEDSTLPACTSPTCTPPLGAGSRCLKSISASPGYQAYAMRDYGSEQTKTFTRFYLYVKAEGLDDGDVKPLGVLRNSTGANVVVFGLNRNAGQLRFLLRLYYNNGSSYYDDYFDISTNTNRWYRIEFEYYSTFFTFYSEWKVDGVSQGSGTLSVTHYNGIQTWNFGFWSALAETGTIYFDKVAVDNNDWVGEETDMLLHGGRLFDTSAEFCFKCHDKTTNYATSAIKNRSYSYRAGGYTDDSVDDILEAFSFTSPGSFHNLSDIKTFITDPLRLSWGYTSSSNPCASCHNPHIVQGDPANSPDATKSPSTRGYPVTRPSEHATNYNNIWGDDATERISGATTFYWAPKRVGGGYEPDGSSTQDGSNMPNYVFLCLDCHNTTNVIWSTRLNRNLRKISWGATDTGDFHGVKARNDGGSFACVGECGDLIEPYKVGGSYGKTNYILSCTDCHEPHGSPNEFLLRPTLNGYQANVANGGPFSNEATCAAVSSEKCFYYLCKACHTTHYDPPYTNTGPTAACYPCHHHCDPEFETCGGNFF